MRRRELSDPCRPRRRMTVTTVWNPSIERWRKPSGVFPSRLTARAVGSLAARAVGYGARCRLRRVRPRNSPSSNLALDGQSWKKQFTIQITHPHQHPAPSPIAHVGISITITIATLAAAYGLKPFVFPPRLSCIAVRTAPASSLRARLAARAPPPRVFIYRGASCL